jgi:hypothetical protein
MIDISFSIKLKSQMVEDNEKIRESHRSFTDSKIIDDQIDGLLNTQI